ncbi:MAG: hypothetical protein PHP09_04655 [Bacilli bacterium]|jgi:hypothetical protein|nr:hypothetical protein [Bacilli bacterium]MDD4521274.1 hypothetical protein [Bacilli bacterium]
MHNILSIKRISNFMHYYGMLILVSVIALFATWYWMVNALQTLQMHSASAWMEIEQKVAASIYDNGSDEIALLWNASNYTEEVTLHRADGTTVQVTVAARSFTSVVI